MPETELNTIKKLGARAVVDNLRLNNLDFVAKIVSKHALWIDGDPDKDTPGARERLRNVEEDFAEITDRLNNLTKWMMGVAASVITGIVVYVIINIHPGP